MSKTRNFTLSFLKPATIIALGLVAIFSVFMLRIMAPYATLQPDAGFLVTKQGIIHIKHWRYAFYVHVATSIFVLSGGILQFIKSFPYQYPKLHRYVGTAYVLIVVLLSGPAGLIMGFYANGGPEAKTSFVVLSILWISTTAMAYVQARQKNFTSHQNWMVYSYALTLSAVTLRLYATFLPAIVHLSGHDEYVLLAWASWVPNVLVATLLIWLGKTTI